MTRVLITDDHAIVRRGLKQILTDGPGGFVFGEASSAEEVYERVRKEKWDVVILDLSLPDASGLDVLKRLKAEHPRLPVLVLSMHPEDPYALRVLRAGASGYMTKESAPDQLVAAVKKVIAGGKYVSDTLAERLALELESGTKGPLHKALSDQEFQVFCRLAAGKSVGQIADQMSLSVKTVSTYRTRVLEKMNMNSNADLTRYALEHKLIV
jgi:two-component system, NarL family, invasion response regulator UvrY